MDILLSSFVKKYINIFSEAQLRDLENFLKIEDEEILNYYNHNKITNAIEKNKISKIFQEFKI